VSRRTWSGRQISKALPKKGFRKSQGDHHWYYLYVNGEKTNIRTKISHGNKDYTGDLWSCLRKQLKLSNDDLDNMLACHIGHDRYVEILVENNHI